MSFATGYCQEKFNDMNVLRMILSVITYAFQPVYVAGIGFLIPIANAAANAAAAFAYEGGFDFTIANGVTLVAGNVVYYDTTNHVVQLLKPTAGYLLGTVVTGGLGDASGVASALININEFASVDNSAIVLLDDDGTFKGSYATINLAVAAAANDDIIKIGNGSFTLTAACDITKTGLKIIGSDKTTVVGFAGADYCFKTVFGAITTTKEITFKNINLDHGDDSTQQGIVIDNASATGRINAYLENVSGESDGGDTIHVEHTAAAASIRMYVTGGTFEGPVNFAVKNTDDRIRFEGSTLRGGLVTSADNIAMEIELWNSKVLHQGVTGGHSSQLVYALYCLSETDANPNVYAALDSNDLAGSHSETVLFPAV